MPYLTIENTTGITPLLELRRSLAESARSRNNLVLGKWECANPSASVKDRVVKSMIDDAEEKGAICPGDTLIEASNGNTGIALAMQAASRGYRSILIMPENTDEFKRQSMAVDGAEIILTPRSGGIRYARDLALQMAAEGKGFMLDQFSNPANPMAHFKTTGPEIWAAAKGKVTHFVCAIGTSGTIMGVSRYLKERNKKIRVIGVEPEDKARISGMIRWPDNQRPKIYEKKRIDHVETVNQACAEYRARKLAADEGIFCGLSSACACEVALNLSESVNNATIVFMIADRGDRYFSSGFFPV